MIDSLPMEDQLSLWVGRVTREYVELELAVAKAHQRMSGSPSPYVMPKAWQTLYERAVEAVPVSALPLEDRAHAVVALEDAHAAVLDRHRVVHDLWRAQEPAPEGSWVSVQYEGDPAELRDLDRFRLTHDRLSVARLRVGAIYFLLIDLETDRLLTERGIGIRSSAGLNRRIMRGDFILRPDGSAQFLDRAEGSTDDGSDKL